MRWRERAVIVGAYGAVRLSWFADNQGFQRYANAASSLSSISQAALAGDVGMFAVAVLAQNFPYFR